MENLFTLENGIALLTLTVLEIVLGIDNIVFISILADKLPEHQRAKARQMGLGLALVTRILLLLSLSWIIKLEEPLFTLPVLHIGISGRDLILLGGGLFLIYKATHEIHDKLEGKSGHAGEKVASSLAAVVIQIGLLDIVFSLDSVITAVGMARVIAVMVTAVIIAVIIMLFASGPISAFVSRHPTVKILALSFLLLIGTALVAEGLHQHIEKGYVYFAMGFSVFVELLNMRLRAVSEPVQLHSPYAPVQAVQPTPVKKKRR
ncbi:MAG: TerC family protein [Anaerolineales bacterium]|nr:TerC family protein [Anaerolineales bacterium]MDW8278655.1 TerC family protein [Anaerolineales bacterium]